MKRKIISVICTSALILCAVGSGCSNNNSSSSVTTEKPIILNVGGKQLYNSGMALYVINGKDNFEYAELGTKSAIDIQGLPAMINAVPTLTAVSENDIYGYETDKGEIYHWDISDPKDVKKETLYTIKKLQPAVKKAMEENKHVKNTEETAKEFSEHILTSWNNFVDGGDGYIYAPYNPAIENFGNDLAINYMLIKFAKDGKDIGLVSDIRAGALTAKDGWLYYYDPGYTLSDANGLSYDRSKAGIYKSKSDGSEKKALVSGITSAELEGRPNIAGNVIGRMEIIKNELYYIDNSDKGESYLYKVSLDGGEPEKLTKNPCSNYHVDTASDTLYYFSGKFREADVDGNNLISVSLGGGDEKTLFNKYSTAAYNVNMGVLGDYLYISDSSRFRSIEYLDGESTESQEVCGQRWDLRNNEMQELHCTVNVKQEQNIKSATDLSIKWEKKEPKGETDGIKSYT